MSQFLPNFSAYGYQILQELGQNRHAGRITYLAEAIDTKQQVVIKQFKLAQQGATWEDEKALLREIELLQQLNHPRIPKYLTSFESTEGLCLVQEYINAPSASQVKSLSVIQIKAIALSVLEILSYLQSQCPPVYHRDIKPENILIDSENQAYLIDLGCGRWGEADFSGSTVVKGTPGFMPPEQLWGQITAASDLYSLGITLICIIKGIKTEELKDLRDSQGKINVYSFLSGVSRDFLHWLDTMIQPDPHQRYQNAQMAATHLINIDPIPSAWEKVPIVSEVTNNYHLTQIFTVIVGLSIGLIWGWHYQAIILGILLGGSLGVGLNFTLTTVRRSQMGKKVLGSGLIALTIGILLIYPTQLDKSPVYSVDIWLPPHQLVGEGEGFSLYSDVPLPAQDRENLAFLNQFRQEVADYLFDPGPTTCQADIFLLREEKNYYGVANPLGMTTSYGFFIARQDLPNPILVVREDSGLGTLTHQMIYHYLRCSYPQGLPTWASQGAASFVEKFLAIEEAGQLQFSWGYRSNWRDPRVRKRINNPNFSLEKTLISGQEQSIYRSLFLYLHENQQLVPLLNRLHGMRNQGLMRLEEIFNQPLSEVEKSWREWLEKDALWIPKVEASFMVWGEDVQKVKDYLSKFWQWDASQERWLSIDLSGNDTIPSFEKILSRY
ncbi:MAG: serine/threonine protein kinase [Microcystaceae cyanobacterium]